MTATGSSWPSLHHCPILPPNLPLLPQLTQATGNILGVTPVQYVSWNGAAARALSLPLLLASALLAAGGARWLA